MRNKLKLLSNPPLYCLIALVFLCTAGRRAQAGGDSSFNFADYLERTRTNYNLPALSVLVLRNGQVVAAGASGVRQAAGPAGITIKDKLLLGSCTKSMGATLIGALVGRGSIRWNWRLEEAFPELIAVMRPEYRGMTLANLLSHTAGFHNVTQGSGDTTLVDPVHSLSENHQWRYRYANIALSENPEYPPGTAYNYSNVGPPIAALMAERATGVDWEKLMDEYVFKPLAMSSAGFGRPEPLGQANQPWGHEWIDGRWVATQTGISSDWYAATGGVFCNIEDWARYIQFHLSGGSLMGESELATLHKPPFPDVAPGYAMGWSVCRFPWSVNTDVLVHGGGNGHQTAMTWVFPRRNFAILFHVTAEGPSVEEAKQVVVETMTRQYMERLPGTYWIQASEASLTGSLILNSQTRTVGGGNWGNHDSRAEFSAFIEEAGRYLVHLSYALPRGISGDYAISIGDEIAIQRTANTDTWSDFRSDQVTTVFIPRGKAAFVLSKVTPHFTFLDVNGIAIQRVDGPIILRDLSPPSNPKIAFGWMTTAGIRYRVQTTDRISATGDWGNIDPEIIGDGGVSEFSIEMNSHSNQFFRVVSSQSN